MSMTLLNARDSISDLQERKMLEAESKGSRNEQSRREVTEPHEYNVADRAHEVQEKRWGYPISRKVRLPPPPFHPCVTNDGCRIGKAPGARDGRS